jgi:hypothetical protein
MVGLSGLSTIVGHDLAFRDDNNAVKFVGLPTLKLTHGIPDHGSVDCLAFAPDGQTLATADREGVVKRWEVKTALERDGPRPSAAGEARAGLLPRR